MDSTIARGSIPLFSDARGSGVKQCYNAENERVIMKKAILLVAALLMALAVLGCGSSTMSSSPTTTPAKISNPDVNGSWMVKGQSATQYSLTLYPDETYKMTYQGTQSQGKFALSANTVTLTPSSGPQLILNRKGDSLVGTVTWTRV